MAAKSQGLGVPAEWESLLTGRFHMSKIRKLVRLQGAGRVAATAALGIAAISTACSHGPYDSSPPASTTIRLVPSPPVNRGPAPRFAVHVIGRLPGSEASLPQSIDSTGDVAGLSGGVSLTSPFGKPLLEYGGHASIFLYSAGGLRKIPNPRSTHGPVYPVNVVLLSRHRLAATFGTIAGNQATTVRVASVRNRRFTWQDLPLPAKLAHYGLDWSR